MKTEIEELKRLLSVGSLENVQITRDKYNNITIVKTPLSISSKYKVGIDEAGRGPLAGPLVYGLVYWPKDPENIIYNDSKKVGKTKRIVQYADLFKEEETGFIIRCLSPLFLSINMLCNKKDKVNKKSLPVKIKSTVFKKNNTENTKKTIQHKLSAFMKNGGEFSNEVLSEPEFICPHRLNLSALSIDCILNSLKMCTGSGIPISEVYVDTVGPKRILQKIIKDKTKGCNIKRIVVEEKADSKYQIVGAASILAKVCRDLFLESPDIWNIMYKETEFPGVPVTGYPSDVKTIIWMKKSLVPIFGFSSVFRIAWNPVMKIVLENKPKSKVSVHEQRVLLCYLKKAE